MCAQYFFFWVSLLLYKAFISRAHDLLIWSVDNLMPKWLSKYMTYNELDNVRTKALKKLAKSN